jgi:hypothetical protein
VSDTSIHLASVDTLYALRSGRATFS